MIIRTNLTWEPRFIEPFKPWFPDFVLRPQKIDTGSPKHISSTKIELSKMNFTSFPPTVTSIEAENYKEYIRKHPNYSFIPEELKKTWVHVSNKNKDSRSFYWDNERNRLIESDQIPKESKLANVARYIHPTKSHLCKKCKKWCSIYYVYPTANTRKWLNKLNTTYNYVTTDASTIFEIYTELNKNNELNNEFEKYFGMSMADLETQCKSDKYYGSKLSPGVMSNAPDRLDGFHCLNSVCGCRTIHDKGRHHENMKSYGCDRRAYELYSDGNCLLANAMMGKLNTITANCIICGNSNQMTADHIGPISLGFIHDPVNFQACCNSCNSSKNNRITEQDITKIKSIEANGTCLVSWWAIDSWEKSKDMSVNTLKDNLLKNTKKFQAILLWLKIHKHDILKSFNSEIYMDHDKSYKISNLEITSSGDIKYEWEASVTGKKTKKTQKDRTERILLEINEKKNAKIKISLSENETAYMSDITLANFKNKICKVLEGL